MQYIVSFINGEMSKADFDPLVVQLGDMDCRNLEQTISRAHEVLKKLNRKSGGQLTPEESPPALTLQHILSPRSTIRINYAPGFVTFLKGRQVALWRHTLLHVRENRTDSCPRESGLSGTSA